jgi:hypothetical protein
MRDASPVLLGSDLRSEPSNQTVADGVPQRVIEGHGLHDRDGHDGRDDGGQEVTKTSLNRKHDHGQQGQRHKGGEDQDGQIDFGFCHCFLLRTLCFQAQR